MKCANCNCEIGNLTQCPYCGHKNRYVYRAQDAGQYGTVGQYAAPTRSAQPSYSSQRRPASYPARADRSQTVSYSQNAPTRTDRGQTFSYSQNAPTRTDRGQPPSYSQNAPTRTDRSRTLSYPQSTPVRTANPEPRSTARRRTSRESNNVELLLRLILLMQCVIALLLTVELVIGSIAV